MRGEQKDKRFAAWEHFVSAAVEAAPMITTMAMNYDLRRETLRDLYDPMCDYVRYRELELLSEMIRMRNVPGAVAEAGVDLGQTSAVLSRLLPNREMFLPEKACHDHCVCDTSYGCHIGKYHFDASCRKSHELVLNTGTPFCLA